MNSRKEKIIAIVMTVLAVVVLVSTVAYLITDKMIPGLMPLSQAALMVPMFLLWRNREPKWISYLFILAGILNLIAVVMQIAVPH